MRILFLFQTIEHVRFRKRVRLLEEAGVTASVLYFERRSYPGEELSCQHKSLGIISHRNYLKRLLPFIKSSWLIRKWAKDNSFIYAFGLDMFLLAWVATLGYKKKLIYEVGDIREALIGSGLKNRMFRLLERFLVKRSELLVVTSEAYLSEYFSAIQDLENVSSFVMENKLVRGWFNEKNNHYFSSNRNDHITIGYFGVLRCARSWDILKTLAEEGQGAYRVYLRGVSRIIELKKEMGINHLEYAGPYLVPDDLPEMYGKVDLVWACYPYQAKGKGNWQWAKTVRFYEACYFKKPLIVQAGTKDGQVVQDYDLGLVIDMNEGVEKVVKCLQDISWEDIARWKENLLKLPEEIYLHTDEHKRLIEKLK